MPYNNFKTALVCAYYGRPEKLEEADSLLSTCKIL